MLNINCLAALFKCMDFDCSFYSSSTDIFEKHLQLHEAQGDFTRSYLNCAYCTTKEKTIHDLVVHIRESHGDSRYQCHYCFFRAFSEFQVTSNHHKYCHHTKQRLVIRYGTFLSQEMKLRHFEKAQNSLKTIVPKLVCVICRSSFYGFARFSKHMAEHEETGKMKCSKCGVIVDKLKITNHFNVCFNFGYLQCAHCRFGTNSIATIEDHIAMKHFNKIAVYCKRPTNVAENVDEVNEGKCFWGKFKTQI
jgi:hypothetical protein